MIVTTAQEFLEDFDYKNQELGNDINYPMIEKCMIEFAKLHVLAALAEVNMNLESKLLDSSIPHVIDSSIFDIYSLTNIK